ncbi:glycerophosphodiester phosphodiesterase [Ideonella sp. 4Y11]|uniref:Glycerophosphodiester phosphodiesterase n=1 Tax=Ideonella aquatica TaxID=2824119 RepID=A0A940YFI1_9BURK|nr:glycerophosphodiester phosphodiesterase [Ideonella aquatica]MBQ0959210.1 glycerophosphodiester phosphodiesterase [Ideonella aquatica]
MSLHLRAAALALILCSALSGACAFDLQSHRGGRGLWPENTLAAFERSIRLGVTTLEMDAAVTADGVVVIHHDRALNKAIVRDAEGRFLTRDDLLIHRLSLAEVKRHDVGRHDSSTKYGRDFPDQQAIDGQRIPTLAEVFELVRRLGAKDIHFDIETKLDPRYPEDTLAPEPFVDALLSVIRAHGMTPRVMVQSFDWRTLQLLHKKQPGLRTMYLTMDFPDYSTVRDGTWTAGHLVKDHGGSVPRAIRASAGDAPGVIWGVNHRNLTPALLKEARGLGLVVIPWTINDQARMAELIDWGVDGIITDYPDRLRAVMTDKGLPLPAGVK